MQTRTLTAGDQPVVEIVSPDVLIRNGQDALELIGSAGWQHVILHEHNFERDFFDLSTRKLGDILQKFVNYRANVAIVGDFAKYPSQALQAFIRETNRGGAILFVSSPEEALSIWQNR